LSKRLEAGRYRKLDPGRRRAAVSISAAELAELLRAVRNTTSRKKIVH